MAELKNNKVVAAEAPAEKTAEALAAEKKAPVKRGRKPAAEKKETTDKKTAVKPAAKKSTAKSVAEKAVEVLTEKAAEKKAVSRKNAAEKAETEKAEAQASVIIQFGGKEILAKEILDKAKAAFAAANEGVEIQTIELYVKPEEHAAYYVVNGVGSTAYKIEL